MDIIINILNLIFLLIFIYLGVYCLYLFIFSLSGKLIHIPPPPVTEQLKKFVIYPRL